MNSEKISTIIKAAFIMFIFTSFLDKITGLAKSLLGGVELQSGSSTATEGLAKAYEIGGKIQARGTGAAKKLGGAIGRASIEAISKFGNMGKKQAGKATDEQKVDNHSGQAKIEIKTKEDEVGNEANKTNETPEKKVTNTV